MVGTEKRKGSGRTTGILEAGSTANSFKQSTSRDANA